MYEVKSDRTGKSSKCIHNYSCRLQIPLSVIDRTKTESY